MFRGLVEPKSCADVRSAVSLEQGLTIHDQIYWTLVQALVIRDQNIVQRASYVVGDSREV